MLRARLALPVLKETLGTCARWLPVRGVFLSGGTTAHQCGAVGAPLPPVRPPDVALRGERNSAAARVALQGVRDGMLLRRRASPPSHAPTARCFVFDNKYLYMWMASNTKKKGRRGLQPA